MDPPTRYAVRRSTTGLKFVPDTTTPKTLLMTTWVPPELPLNNNIAKYTQAQFGVINENRFTFRRRSAVDVLPGLDFDFFAGGMPRVSHNFGSFTSVNLESYWIGAGLTWRFGDMYYIERR